MSISLVQSTEHRRRKCTPSPLRILSLRCANLDGRPGERTRLDSGPRWFLCYSSLSSRDSKAFDENALCRKSECKGMRRIAVLYADLMFFCACSAKKTYQFIAWAASFFLFGLAAFATAFRFFITKPKGSPFPWIEFAGTLALVAGGTVRTQITIHSG